MKFGGSCLESADSFKRISDIVKIYLEKSNLIIITSAIYGVTDQLLDYYVKSCSEAIDCQNIIEEIKNSHSTLIDHIINSKREEYGIAMRFIIKNVEEIKQLGRVIQLIRPSLDIQDLIVSYGEKLSTFILTQYLKSIDIISDYVSSSDIIVTDDNFGNALPLLDDTEIILNKKVKELLSKEPNQVICITGFYGSTKKDKKITTFGRGGSDLTAAVVAYSLRNSFKCNVIYWKDVRGLLDADPTMANKTSLIMQISYVEAKELAFFGSKVLHPLCLAVSEKGKIPSEIRAFSDPFSNEYTTITKDIIVNDNIIKAITSIYKLSMVTIEGDTMIPLPGTASKLFSLLGDNKVSIIFISQSSSENNITFGIDFEDSKKVSFLLRESEWFGKSWFRIKINNEISLVAIIGAGILHAPGIAGKVFTTLGKNNINILAMAQGSSELNFTAIIERKNCKKAINILYDAFITEGKKK